MTGLSRMRLLNAIIWIELGGALATTVLLVLSLVNSPAKLAIGAALGSLWGAYWALWIRALVRERVNKAAIYIIGFSAIVLSAILLGLHLKLRYSSFQ